MIDTAGLIVDDRDQGMFRVHRTAMTSDEVFALERERIFDTCWLYLGHESEVDKPGDYKRRMVNGRPLIFVRDSDGEVRAFFNSCTHRGAMVCREEQGNARVFQCFYHAWTFNTKGEVVAVPDQEGYSPCIDWNERSLRSPAKVEGYRGFWFVNFNPDAESLVDYLGNAAEYLDLIVDQANEGMRVVPGTNLYSTRANWKLLVENSIDGYHALPLHQTYIDYVKSIGGGLKPGGLTVGGGLDLGNGHSVMISEAPWARPIAHWEPLFGEDAKEEIEQIRADIVEKYGEERAFRMCDQFRNLLIFPNLIINDIAALTVRYINPVAPNYIETTAWQLAPREEEGERLARRLDSYLTFIGPGGFATPDDVEALESCQKGFETFRELEYSDISRGMGRVSGTTDELQIRTFWRRWHAQLEGGGVPQQVTGIESEDLIAAEPGAAR